MKKRITFIAIILLFLAQSSAYAHPGRTDANGGHTCRTNCEKWGLSYGEYHYHNGNAAESSSTTTSSDSNSSWDKDCSDFSNYDEVVEYWNAKGYSKTNDPEKLDGWGNAVDDGIPCEAPGGYDTSKINGSPEQIAQRQAEQDEAKGETDGYASGLADGQKGKESDSSTEGSEAYQDGYETGYNNGYQKGTEQLEKQKKAANKEGYALGQKQDKLSVPKQYASVAALKSSFEEGFNKAVAERDEAKKKEYRAAGTEDGKNDQLHKPKNIKSIYIDAYMLGYDEGQQALKEMYIKQGYDAAFKMVKYQEPDLEKSKYIEWYKEGFESNTEIDDIKTVAYESGLDGEEYKVPAKYANAEPVYKDSFEKGAQERSERTQTTAGVLGLGVFGWLGRRFYVARKMIKQGVK